MKTKTKKTAAENSEKEKSAPRLPTVDEIANRLVTIIHNTIEALSRCNNDPMFNTDAFVREQVGVWLDMGVPKPSIGEAAGIALDRLFAEDREIERIKEQWGKRIMDVINGNFIKRTFDERMWHHRSPDYKPFDFYEVQPVTPRPENADLWVHSRDMIYAEERVLLIIDAQRHFSRLNELIDNLEKRIDEDEKTWETHSDLADVRMSREHGIPVTLSGPSFENAASYCREWREAIDRQCEEDRKHPELQPDDAALDAEIARIFEKHKTMALQPTEDYNELVKYARAQTKEPTMIEGLIAMIRKAAEMRKEYAEKLEREEVARRLQAAKEAGNPITITEAANQLSGTGGMLEMLNGYKNKASLDIAVRNHAESILQALNINVMEFVKKQTPKPTKQESSGGNATKPSNS